MKGKFEQFMSGFVTAVQLSDQAVSKGCFIESVCLATSILDALLRIGLILKYQIDNKTNKILEELLHQSDEDKIISERSIYQKAFAKKIIDKRIFNKLEKLYKRRNKVVHRYIISNITTKDVLLIGAAYSEIINEVKAKISYLEERQIELGVGMTRLDTDVPTKEKENLNEMLEDMITRKLGDKNLAKNLKHVFEQNSQEKKF